jgi:hypothetical protein
MFEWTHAYIGEEGPKTSYRLDGVEVARLTRRVDQEAWIALLKQHRVAEPRITRQCSSFEAGQRGVELWAERHRDRLQVDVDKINALRRQKQARIGGRSEG